MALHSTLLADLPRSCFNGGGEKVGSRPWVPVLCPHHSPHGRRISHSLHRDVKGPRTKKVTVHLALLSPLGQIPRSRQNQTACILPLSFSKNQPWVQESTGARCGDMDTHTRHISSRKAQGLEQTDTYMHASARAWHISSRDCRAGSQASLPSSCT